MDLATLRSYKIPLTGGMVIFDWVLTLVGALIVSLWWKTDYLITLVVLLIISIVLHYMLGVPTMTNYYLGLSSRP